MGLPWEHPHLPKPWVLVLTLESWAHLLMSFTCQHAVGTRYLSW